MNPKACERVCISSRKKAEEYYSAGCVGRAFSHFLVALKLKPAWKEDLKEMFHDTLNEWAKRLLSEGRANDAWNCYTQAIDVFPENDLIHYSYGLFLLRYHSYGATQAINSFRNCLRIDEWNLTATRHLENACNLAVERWHFRMLNDEVRNCSFREAIIKKVRAGNRQVLDIGTGTGLLSLFAVEGGAESVFACDSSPAMLSLARQVFKQENASDVEVIEKHSTDLVIPGDLPVKVSLVVCEIVDCGLLGEHAVDTLIHAWRNLLKPTGSVIPCGATFYLCGIESTHISEKWIAKEFSKTLGLDDLCIIVENNEYDTECLDLIPRGFVEITNTVTPFTINFNDEIDLKDVIEGKKDVCVKLTCNRQGYVDCVAGWFSLRLDEDIVINTNPGSEVKCWDQAVFPSPHLIQVQPGDDINLFISLQGGQTKVTFPNVNTSQPVFKISQRVVSLLNDVAYVCAMQSIANKLAITMQPPFVILDTTAFPLMGLSLIQGSAGKNKLVSICSSPGDRALVSFVAERSGAEVCFIESDRFIVSGESELYDVILLDVIETNGELNDYYLSHIDLVKRLLKPHGLLLPYQVDVMGQFVESEWIRKVSRVLSSDVTCGYDVARYINEFQVQHQLDFNLDSINAINRSHPFLLFELSLLAEEQKLESQYTVPVTQPGRVDALIYWYNICYLPGNAVTVSTNSAHPYFNMAALLLDELLSDFVNVKLKYQDGLFAAKV